MGAELNIEQGYQAFRLSALNAISQLKAALGNLDRVKQIVRLEGTMGCAPGFHDQPKVLDGASHVVNQVFGPRGRQTRERRLPGEGSSRCRQTRKWKARCSDWRRWRG